MKIIVDAFGGDNAPLEIIKGCAESVAEFGINIILTGKEETIRNVAKENNIPVQTKTAVAGGNDAGAIQTSGSGTRVMAISLPTRYIHSGASVVKASDIEYTRSLINKLLPRLYY